MVRVCRGLGVCLFVCMGDVIYEGVGDIRYTNIVGDIYGEM